MDNREFISWFQYFIKSEGLSHKWLHSELTKADMRRYSDAYSKKSLITVAQWCAKLGYSRVTRGVFEFVLREAKIPLASAEIDRSPAQRQRNTSKPQRMMDRLSRLLSVHNSISMCIAVMIFNGELLIASNSPYPKTVGRKEQRESILRLEFYLSQKYLILQQFLTQKLPLLQGNELRIKPETKVAILGVVESLIKKDLGYADETLVHPPKGLTHTTELRHRLIKDLCKLSSSYLCGLASHFSVHSEVMADGASLTAPAVSAGSNVADGISAPYGMGVNELTAFTRHARVFVAGAREHAEQLLVHYHDTLVLSGAVSRSKEVIPLGITKLSCYDCHDFLATRPDFSYRGTHGIAYPTVAIGHPYYLANEGKSRPAHLQADDSDSDIDILATPPGAMMSLVEASEAALAVARHPAGFFGSSMCRATASHKPESPPEEDMGHIEGPH